jgi:hypothetical protein
MKSIANPFNAKRLVLALTSASVLVLTACGGGDDDDAPAVPTGTLSGVVVDGLLQAATVCLDLNDNRACDTGEPTAVTDAKGAYTLTAVDPALAALHPVLAVATATTTIDADHGPVKAGFMLAAPPGKHAYISPFTTLAQSEIDGGRAVNVAQAQDTIYAFMVGTAGDVGGLTLDTSYLPDSTASIEAKRLKMYGMGQLLTGGFAKTAALGLTGKEAVGALGLAATGSLQQLLTPVTGPLTLAERDALLAANTDSLVPTKATLDAVKATQAKTAATPIEGAWIKSTTVGATTTRELFLFAGDGTFVHQTLSAISATPTPATTAFDSGFGLRYGRYTFANGTLTFTVIEASEEAGPATGPIAGVTVSGNTLTLPGATFTRVASTTDPLVGGWIRPNGSAEPEFLVMFEDKTYFHSTFYNQNDAQLGTASALETAKSAGSRQGKFTHVSAATGAVTFDELAMSFNGTLAIPSSPGVATLQSDGSLTMTGLRLVKLGTPDGAKAILGLSEATRSRLWSGRYFSRTVGTGGAARLQYTYVRGPNDVVSFFQAPTGSTNTVACALVPADFTTVAPTGGKLMQFVIGTGTGATAGYAQRRLNVGTPSSYVTYTPLAKPTNATARCAVPS